MTKANLKVGMLVVTADGKKRLVVSSKNDGLLLMAEDNKALKLSKMNDDLTSGSYNADKNVVEVYDIMNDVNGHLFDTTNRDKFFTKADVTPGMLVVTHDGKKRLVIPTEDMGLVLATENSKFIRLDKLNEDLTIRDYRDSGRNVDQVYSVASGETTDFYSTEGRDLLFNRNEG